MKKMRANLCFSSAILFAGLTCASVQAALIASESFATPSGYVAGVSFGADGSFKTQQKRTNETGTTGFTRSQPWLRYTATITPREGGLTHPLAMNPPGQGHVLVIPPAGADGGRSSTRNLAGNADANTLYMSGLVSLRGALGNLANSSWIAMGVAPKGTHIKQWDSGKFDDGVAMGLVRGKDGKVYLAAFAGGTEYLLGDALTDAQADGAHLIVLKLEREADGSATLTAWYAPSGQAELTEALKQTGLSIDSGKRGFGMFGISAVRTDAAARGATGGVALGQWRLGDSLEDVVRSSR